MWADGSPEPAEWQAEAYDASSDRLTAGTFGLWSYSRGAKYWDDLLVEPLTPVELLDSSSNPLEQNEITIVTFDIKAEDLVDYELRIENPETFEEYGQNSMGRDIKATQAEDPIPEPATLFFFGIGLFGILVLLRTRKR